MASAQEDTDDIDVVCHSGAPTCCLNPVNYLPNEVLWKIIGFLTAEDLCHLAGCNKAWRNVTNINSLWHRLCKLKDWERFGTEVDLRKEAPIHSDETSTSDTSPTFPADTVVTGDCDLKDLTPTCEWKEVYMRAWHLDRNWSEGRYHEQNLELSEFHDGMISVASDGRTFAAADDLGFVRLWDLNNGHFLRNIEPYKFVQPLNDYRNVFLVLKNNIGVAVFKGGILVFEGNTGNVLKLIQVTNRYGLIRSCVNFEENKIIITYTCYGHFLPLHIWDIRSDSLKGGDNGTCTQTILHAGPTDYHSTEGFGKFLGCHGHLFITCKMFDKPRKFLLWDMRTPEIIRVYTGHEGTITCGHLNEDTIMTGDNESEIKVWSTASDDCLMTLYKGAPWEFIYPIGISTLHFTSEVIVATTSAGVVFWRRNGTLLNRRRIRQRTTSKIYNNRLVINEQEAWAKHIQVFELSTGKCLYHWTGTFSAPTLVHVGDTRIVVRHYSDEKQVTILHYW